MDNLVECIDSSNRPNEVSITNWIKTGTIYTVIKGVKCLGQGGLLGYELEEVKIDSALYKYFAANRFRPLNSPVNIEELMEIKEII